MKIHEYQGKQLFRTYGVPVLRGEAVTTAADAERVARELGSPVVVVKSQIHAGGRGKGTVYADAAATVKVLDGGVKVVRSPADARAIADKLLGNFLKTIQTGDSAKQVKTLYIEDGCQIAKELYVSILLDRTAAAPVLIVSSEGGMDIEEVAHRAPEKILQTHFDPQQGIGAYQARRLGYEIGLTPPQVANFVKAVQALGRTFLATDADMLEVNPLVVTAGDEVVALDCKMSFDDNALFRHPEIAAFLDANEEDAAELEAKSHDMAFVKLTGNIGCMVNGAGLAMATMDAIALYGASEGAFPANFLDVGGGATAEKVTTAFKILVNIFGGIMKCDTIATGVLTAVRDVGLDRPLVVRLEGTNVAQGKKLIADSGLPVIAADGLKDGCMKAAQAANAYRIGRGLPPHPALPTPPAIAYIPRRRPALAKARSQAGPAKAAKPAKTHKPAKRATAPARRARSATRPASGKAKRPGKRR